MNPVYVAGAGMTNFGRSEWSLIKLASVRPRPKRLRTGPRRARRQSRSAFKRLRRGWPTPSW